MFARTRALSILVVLTVVAGCSGAAYTGFGEPDGPKLVVLNVKGKRGKAIRGDVVEMLQQSDYQLVPKRRYIKTARRLKATKLRGKHISKVSAELGVSAVISGRVRRRGKRRYVILTVHDGASGARVERFRVRLTRKRRLTRKGTTRLEKRLMAALSEVKPAAERDEVAADKTGDDKADDDKADDSKLSKRERRRRARAEKRRERKEARERKREAAAKKRREARERKERQRERREARKRKERERKRKEAKVVEEVVNPETDESGQAIDEEAPPGL